MFANVSFAQTETAAFKKVAAEFEKNFNANDFEGIFNQFSSPMQTAVPLDKLTNFLTNLSSEAGEITKLTFVKYQNGGLALYKINFERKLLGFNLSIDGNSEINGMQFIPFKEDNLPKMERNISKLILPFKGEWTVFWGGDTKELNYHVVEQAQKNTFDRPGTKNTSARSRRGVAFREWELNRCRRDWFFVPGRHRFGLDSR